MVEVASLVPRRPAGEAARCWPTSTDRLAQLPGAAPRFRISGPVAKPSCTPGPGLSPEAPGERSAAVAAIGSRTLLTELAGAWMLCTSRSARRRAGDWPTCACRSSTSAWPGTWPRTCTGCAKWPRRRRSPWPTCRRSCASAMSARAANGCCASSPRIACGTSSRWSTSPRRSATVDPEATGKPFGTVEGLKAMKNGLQRAGLYAFLVIVAGAAARLPQLAAHADRPDAAGAGRAADAGHAWGCSASPLNPANMIAFPLILGVGVDNGVHVLHDYLIRRREGQDVDQPRHRPGRAGQGADDDDRLRHADDLDGTRPGGTGFHPDAGRGLLDAVGAWCCCRRCCVCCRCGQASRLPCRPGGARPNPDTPRAVVVRALASECRLGVGQGRHRGEARRARSLMALLRKDPSDDVRWGAGQALGKIGSAAVPALIEVLKDEGLECAGCPGSTGGNR